MTQAPFSDSEAMLCVALLAVLPLAVAGLAMLNTGLGRSRSAAQALLGSLCLAAFAAVCYCAVGYGWEGFAGDLGHSLHFGATSWNWIDLHSPFFSEIPWTNSPVAFAAAFQIFAVALLVQIPWGAGSDRWRLSAAFASTFLLASFVYPVFAHWVWAGGWLSRIGANFGLGVGFLDPGGASTIQVLGSLAALSVLWISGPRLGKFNRGSPPSAVPAHHIVNVLFGCLLVFAGWLSLNALGTLLFTGLSGGALILVEVNTFLCAAGALLAGFLITRIRFTKPDASLCANSWVAGLVASSAIAPFVPPIEAILVGAIAGALVPFSVEFLELRCGIDDPSGSLSVHGVSGIWGLAALGLLGHFPRGQFLAQLVGIATLLGLVFPFLYLLHWLLNRALPLRTGPGGDRLGMDMHELGAVAYPEFVIHRDEFLPR